MGAHGVGVGFGWGAGLLEGGLALPAAAVVGAMLLGTPADSEIQLVFYFGALSGTDPPHSQTLR